MRSAAGTTSNRAGVVPIGSPSTSIGSGSAASISTVALRHLDLRVREVLAAVELRRRRDEVELVHVADQHDVEEAVVRRRRPARASSRRRASGRSRRSRRAWGPRAPRRRRAGPSPRCSASARNSRVERVEERRPAAERLRHRVRPPRDGAAHPDRADVREPARLSPLRGSDAAEVDRRAARPRARPAPRRRSRSGSRVCGRSPGRCRSGGRRSRPSGPAIPLTTSLMRPVAADDDEQRARLRRARRSARWPGCSREHRLAGEPELGRALPESGQRLPSSRSRRGVDEEDEARQCRR